MGAKLSIERVMIHHRQTQPFRLDFLCILNTNLKQKISDNGLFGRLKGGGIKGPVKEIKRRLAEHYAVISCSEYRTSKLCIQCGRELHVHKHGVMYCAQQAHCSMLNRDVAAAVKIGALFLAKKSGADLGPWAWGSTVADHAPSRALASALIAHAA